MGGGSTNGQAVQGSPLATHSATFGNDTPTTAPTDVKAE